MNILLVEDDKSSAILAQIALEAAWKKRALVAEIVIRSNGLEALRYLEKCNTLTLPDLILADVKMPLYDGIRLLNALKTNAKFCKIPVVMVTTSDDPKDIESAFQGQCAGYLLKDADFDQFSADLETLQRYWEVSRLP